MTNPPPHKATDGRSKNFLPTLVITILLWILTGIIIFFVDPATFFVVPLFFLLIFFATLFTLSIALASSRHGLLLASGLTMFLILRYFSLGNLLNLILLAGIIISLEYYLGKK